jgi:uncharacterized protein (UPF0276 family)
MHVTVDDATKKLYINSNMTGIETNNFYGAVDSNLIKSILLNLYKFHFDGLSIDMNISKMKPSGENLYEHYVKFIAVSHIGFLMIYKIFYF